MAPPIFRLGQRKQKICDLMRTRGPLNCFDIANALGMDASEVSQLLSLFVVRGILRPAGFSAAPRNLHGQKKAKLYALVHVPQ